MFPSKEFIDFIRTLVHAYTGENQDIIQAVKVLTPLSQTSVVPLKATVDSFLISLSMGPYKGTKVPSSTPEATTGSVLNLI
jgi:hypothetical protein